MLAARTFIKASAKNFKEFYAEHESRDYICTGDVVKLLQPLQDFGCHLYSLILFPDTSTWTSKLVHVLQIKNFIAVLLL